LKTKAIFLENITDYEKLDESIFSDNEYLIFSFNIDVYNFLKNKKHDFKIADEYLTSDDHSKIYEYTTSFYDWHKRDQILETMELEGTNLLGIFDTAELHHLLIREIHCFIILKRILEKFHFTEIYANKHLSIMMTSILKDNYKIIQIPNLHHDFAIPFEKYSIPLSILGYKIPITLSRNTYKKIKSTFESFVGKGSNLWFNPNNSKKSILFLEFNFEQYLDLFKNIKSDKNIILVNMRRPAFTDLNSLKLLKNLNCSIVTPDYFLSSYEKKLVLKNTKKYLVNLNKIWTQSDLLSKIFRIEDCSIWNTIKDILLQTYQRRLEDYVKLILFAKKISTSINLSCIVSLNVIGETEKSILDQNKKIPSILLEHGFTNYVPELSKFDISNMYSLFKDKIALWGNIQKEYLIKQHSIPEERILTIGSSRHDAFFNQNIPHNTSKKTVLITPGQFDEPNAVYDTNSFIKYNTLFKKLLSILKQIPDVSVIIKLHPSQQKNNLYLKKMIQKIDSNIPIKQSTPIINEIQSCDVLINIFPELFPSTVLLEGLILKKPIMNISLYDRHYDFEFEKDESVLSINDSGDLEKNIKKLLFDKEFQSRLIQNGTKHVNRYMSNPGHASKELARILNSY
tara:strand:- start:3352 stop:5229 length:1878 start_codon:yes stop_codon:yes gene_type:complete